MGDLLNHRLLGAARKPHLVKMGVPGGGFIPRPRIGHRQARWTGQRQRIGLDGLVDLVEPNLWTKGGDLPGGGFVSKPVGDPRDRAGTTLIPAGGWDKRGSVGGPDYLSSRETGQPEQPGHEVEVY